MQNFIQGILTGNFEGSTYQDIGYDRVLHVQTHSGRQLEIYDAEGPISRQLQIGETYTFFLSPFYMEEKDVLYYPLGEEVIKRAFWKGKIVELDWRPSKSAVEYECVTARFDQRSWVLIETNDGYMLLDHSVFETTPEIGGIILFGNIDFMLHAVQKY